MPFVYDQSEIEWPEDESDPPPPRADQFVYIPAPDFGGAREPVRFSILPSRDPVEPAEPEVTPERQQSAPAESPRRSFLDRLLGRPMSSPQPSQISYEERRRRSERQREQRRQAFFAIMVPALREIGVRRAYCRYDGGNDEGFAWLDRFEMQDGQRVSTDTMASRLHEMRVQERLYAAEFMKRAEGASDDEVRGEIKSLATDWLCTYWASMLLGDGFGTGEYSMYGAFVVDLERCTIIDDRDATPVVQNIQIEH